MAHGGELQIESLPEQGTTVRFTLPAEPPPAS
jgi:signal transduction histidine kinase